MATFIESLPEKDKQTLEEVAAKISEEEEGEKKLDRLGEILHIRKERRVEKVVDKFVKTVFSLEWRNEEAKKILEILSRPNRKVRVIHGDWGLSPEGEVTFKLAPDLDAKVATWLWNNAQHIKGLAQSPVVIAPEGSYGPENEPIKKGEREKDTTYIYLDLNMGRMRQNWGTTNKENIYFDDHVQEKALAGKDVSTSSLVYEFLTIARKGDKTLLEKKPWIENLVKFVTEIDNLSYPTSEEFLRGQYHNTLYAVYRGLSFDSILKLFRDYNYRPGEEFTEKQKKEMPEIAGLCQRAAKRVNISIDKITKARREMERTGLRLETPELGKYVLNIMEKNGKNKIPIGFDGARALDYDSFITWYENTASFQLSTKKEDLSEGKIYGMLKKEFPDLMPPIKGRMIISGLKEGEDISERSKRHTLEKLIRALNLKAPIEI